MRSDRLIVFKAAPGASAYRIGWSIQLSSERDTHFLGAMTSEAAG